MIRPGRVVDNSHRQVSDYQRAFCLTPKDLAGIVGRFQQEMKQGLKARAGSLAMLPTFVGEPSGKEKGIFLAIDLGGSIFRVLMVCLYGNGRKPRVVTEEHNLKAGESGRQGRGTGYDLTRTSSEKLFSALTGYIKRFLAKHKQLIEKQDKPLPLGFTFSFPATQKAINQASVNKLPKEFLVSGLINKDVVRLFKKAIKKRRLDKTIKVVSLNNDAVATLVARRYGDKNCDIGGIVGTGTNFCYLESVRSITKLGDVYRHRYSKTKMAINIESGNFDRIARNSYDKLLDRASINRGEHIAEKMVSGLYLGELTRLIILDRIHKGLLFSQGLTKKETTNISQKGSFSGPVMSRIARDNSRSLKGIQAELVQWGVKPGHITLGDKQIVKDICGAVDRRAARITAAVVFAIVTHIDQELLKQHTVAIDGSVFEKHAGFKQEMQQALRELSLAIFKQDLSGRICLELTKGGSGIGAAIIAATAIS